MTYHKKSYLSVFGEVEPKQAMCKQCGITKMCDERERQTVDRMMKVIERSWCPECSQCGQTRHELEREFGVE